MSPMMRDIWKCSTENDSKKLVAYNMFKWKVGDGTLVKFWKDRWIGDCPLSSSFQRLFDLSVDKDIRLLDMVRKWKYYSGHFWRRDLR